MNIYLEQIYNLLKEIEMPENLRLTIQKAIAEADKQWTITDFKLDRTEKVKRTTAILLEETIEELEHKRKAIEDSNAALQKTLEDLKATQVQLIQFEKMASLGELTAGIAHEIQNPLNFVNNFSELSRELLTEMKDELATGNIEQAEQIADDVQRNLEKINHHGRRADAIVKAMLQHSRVSSGQKELTDINALVDEYQHLAYHGFRAKEKDFNSNIETSFDDSLGKINIMAQDMGRVILNLFNNAFYAVAERSTKAGTDFQPLVSITTKRQNRFTLISVKDNGDGINPKVMDKIFQPFFTTKPTGQGTGLGLSLSYDIVKAHGGEIKVESIEGEGSVFNILLPTF